MKKLQRLIDKELEKKRLKGKRSLSMSSIEENSPGRNDYVMVIADEVVLCVQVVP